VSATPPTGSVPSATGSVAWMRRIFTQNLSLKLLSIVISVVLFSIVHGAEDAQRSVWVDVVALLPPDDAGKILVSEIPDRIRLIIKGRRSQVNNISTESLPPVTIDLTDGRVSRYSFFDQEFDLPAGVNIVLIDPASIPLAWADRLEKEVPVVARLEGSPGQGLALGRPAVVEPASVRVIGPHDEVDPIRAVQTEPLEFSAMAAGRHVERVSLARPQPHVRYDPESPVRVTLDIVQDLADRTVEGLVVEAVGGEARSLRPERVSVALRGPPAQVDLIDPARLVPFVDLTALVPEAGAVAVPVEIRGVPEGVQVERIEPAEILATP